MQKNFYNNFNDENSFKNNVVGYYDVHQAYPYEKWLLNYGGDESNPLFENTNDLIALDYGCGMGRMVERMSKLFKRVDGVDIGNNLIEYCKEKYPNSNFWVTSGNNCAEAFKEHYDFVFSTICMQHICSHEIRMDIWKSIKECLKIGGKFTFQMYMFESQLQMDKFILNYKNKNNFTPKFARWNDNHFFASTTNSGHDVYILREELPMIVDDTNKIFKNTKVYSDPFERISKLYITGEK